jgi:hypothetical protein
LLSKGLDELDKILQSEKTGQVLDLMKKCEEPLSSIDLPM